VRPKISACESTKRKKGPIGLCQPASCSKIPYVGNFEQGNIAGSSGGHAQKSCSIQQNWKQFRRNIKEKWVKLSDEDLAEINGRRELLEKTIQARYGFASDYVHKEIDDWLRWQHSRPTEPSKNDLFE
jgi:uncharacterized protein YjbJ (UPF0337 family)